MAENKQEQIPLAPHRVIIKFKAWWKRDYIKEGKIGVGINPIAQNCPMLVVWDEFTNRLHPLADVKYYEFTRLPEENAIIAAYKNKMI